MGIGAILATAIKHLSGNQVVNIAIQYGPEIVRKITERLQSRSQSGTGVTVGQLNEMLRELEGALVRQEEIIEEQNRNLAILEENCRILQARLYIFIAVSAASALLSIVAFILSFRR
jgi:hypothetical protein